MQTVRVNRTELLEIVRTNREQHRNIFIEAQEGYRQAVIADLEAMLADAREGRRIRKSWAILMPVDQTKEYDRVIKMLEMSTDTVIELSERDFARYVMDDWEWRQQFLASNARYSKLAHDTAGAAGIDVDEV